MRVAVEQNRPELNVWQIESKLKEFTRHFGWGNQCKLWATNTRPRFVSPYPKRNASTSKFRLIVSILLCLLISDTT
jgi:hypothetical protein